MAAMQFWIVDELVAGMLQVPFIDQLLMPVVFMLDRRIWAYTELISIGNSLIRLPRAIANVSVWMPVMVRKAVGCFQTQITGSGPTVDFIRVLFGTVETAFSGPLALLFVYIALIGTGSVSALVLAWFWGGYVNHHLKRIYGWTFSSDKFTLWEKGANRTRRFLRFDRKLRHRLHLQFIPPFWFWFPISILLLELSLLVVTTAFFPYRPGPTTSIRDCLNSLKA